MSGACCTLPPVEVDYTPKGTYIDVTGLKTYAVGPENSKKVILYIYDIFGFAPQTLQGADLLASLGYRVVIPDILVGDYATPDMFGTPEGEARRKEYFTKFPGSIPSQSEAIGKLAKALKAEGVKLGAIGACWGYKCIVVSEGAGLLDAVAGIHPSFAAADDADKISAPLALLPSKDEDMEIINKIHAAVEAKNPGKNVLKHYPTMPHGWMAARGDLTNQESKEKYADGYQVVADFFKQHL